VLIVSIKIVIVGMAWVCGMFLYYKHDAWGYQGPSP